MDPDDEFGSLTAQLLGADRMVWAYDYPHSDSSQGPVKNLNRVLKELPEEDQKKVLGLNAIEIYKLN